MKYLVVFVSALALSTAYPSYQYPIHPGVGAIFKGPSSETIIKGPDGSVITAAAVGGEVATKTVSGNVVPLVEPILAPITPLINPVITPVVSPIAPLVLKTNPIIVPDIGVVGRDPKIVEEHVVVGNKVITVPKQVEENSDLIGPSGTISTRGGDVVVSGPASTTIKGGGVVASIDKQLDIPVKSVEIKPVVAPVIIKDEPLIAPLISAPIVSPLITEAKPILPIQNLYAPHAPVLNPLGSGIIHPINGPIADLRPLVNDFVVPHYGHGIPSLGLGPLHGPIYRGHIH